MSKFTSWYHRWHLFSNRKVMLQMLREVLSGHYKMSLLTIVVIILSVGYIVYPFDFIPDYIPVLGWIDDGIVFYLLLLRLGKETHRYNRFKAMERKNV